MPCLPFSCPLEPAPVWSRPQTTPTRARAHTSASKGQPVLTRPISQGPAEHSVRPEPRVS